MSIVAKPIKRGTRRLILLCIYLSLSMWTTFALYTLQIYKYSKDCPQYSDLLILYDLELDANIVLRDEVAIGFQKHRHLINKMLKENPALLPHIINFLMNSYGEHIGFDLMEDSNEEQSSDVIQSQTNDDSYTKYKHQNKKSETLKILMKKRNYTAGTSIGNKSTTKFITSYYEYIKGKGIKEIESQY